MDGFMDGWEDGWMDGWEDGRMDGWTDGRMDCWWVGGSGPAGGLSGDRGKADG